MCRKYIFEKYAFRAIGKRPILQFDESEIRGIHPLRDFDVEFLFAVLHLELSNKLFITQYVPL